MKTVGRSTLATSRAYVKSNCRELENELLVHCFEQENTGGVISALSAFQNADGGFGRGLEPDFFLPDSSPIATSVALGVLAELDVASDEPMVQKGVEYLLNTYDPEKRKWHTVPKEVNDYPHASWWHCEEGEGTVLDRSWGNPTAEIVGYLVKYRDLVPADFLAPLHDYTMEYLRDHPDAMEMHELYCLLRFAERISPNAFRGIRDKLIVLVSNAVTTDPERWKQYSAQPLDFATHPDSFLIPSLRDHIGVNLDYWIESMTPEGVWLPTWRWDDYEEDWPKAEKAWVGRITVKRLKVLKSFDRVEV